MLSTGCETFGHCVLLKSQDLSLGDRSLGFWKWFDNCGVSLWEFGVGEEEALLANEEAEDLPEEEAINHIGP